MLGTRKQTNWLKSIIAWWQRRALLRKWISLRPKFIVKEKGVPTGQCSRRTKKCAFICTIDIDYIYIGSRQYHWFRGILIDFLWSYCVCLDETVFLFVYFTLSPNAQLFGLQWNVSTLLCQCIFRSTKLSCADRNWRTWLFCAMWDDGMQ